MSAAPTIGPLIEQLGGCGRVAELLRVSRRAVERWRDGSRGPSFAELELMRLAVAGAYPDASASGLDADRP